MIPITPVIFACAPAILLMGSTFDVAAAANVLGVIAWAKFLDGFGLGRRLPLERIYWLVAAVFILMPVDAFYDWVLGADTDLRYASYVVAAAIMAFVVLYQRAGRRFAPA
jgi:hypothetical protein